MPKCAECPTCADTERKERPKLVYVVCAGGYTGTLLLGIELHLLKYVLRMHVLGFDLHVSAICHVFCLVVISAWRHCHSTKNDWPVLGGGVALQRQVYCLTICCPVNLSVLRGFSGESVTILWMTCVWQSVRGCM